MICIYGMKILTTTEFIKKATEIHGDKYDYSHVDYLNRREKIEIICKEHGSFWQTPANHIYNEQGCPICGLREAHLVRVKPQSKFLEEAEKIHGKVYDYSAVVYKRTYLKVEIKCLLHGLFYQTPDKHLLGQGCPSCRYIKSGNSLTKSTPEFISESQNIHKDRYDYSQTDYKNCEEKIKIVCRRHGAFWQWPMDHLNGVGCPKCGMFISKASTNISNFLSENKIDFQTEKAFDTCRNPKTNHQLKFDFHLPSKNILIEYDGKQHFKAGAKLGGKHITTPEELVAIQYRDGIKTQWAKDNNVKLIRIGYKEDLIGILKKELIS